MSSVQGVSVKPIKQHGNDYVLVADRVHAAHEAEEYKLGFSMVDESQFELAGRYFVRVVIEIDGKHYIGTSEIKFGASIKTADGMAPIECAETSAIGRALGFAGFGLIDSIATDDEIARARNVQQSQQTKQKPSEPAATTPQSQNDAKTEQTKRAEAACEAHGVTIDAFRQWCMKYKYTNVDAAIIMLDNPTTIDAIKKFMPAQPDLQETKEKLQEQTKGSAWEAAHISEEVLQAQEENKKLSEGLGIAQGRLTNEINKTKANINTIEGCNTVKEWLNTPGIANMLWYSQLGITQQQYLAYKKRVGHTDETVYSLLQQGTNERAKLMNAMKETAQPPVNANPEALATDRQMMSIKKLCTALNRNLPNFENMTFNQARELLTQLSHAYSESRPAS
jgi:hypothetical protein